MSDLLPCPFCGGKAELVQNAGYDCPGYIVICTGCDAQIGVSDDPFIAPEYAIAAWNTRATTWEPVPSSLEYDLVSYAMHNGELPPEYVICHKVGQQSTVNTHGAPE